MPAKVIPFNKLPVLYKEVLPNGDTLIIKDKAIIHHLDGRVTGLCLDLRYHYERSKGFIERVARTDKEVVLLGKTWAARQLQK